MNQSDAANVVAYLNAAFPRDALEPESAAIWVTEVSELAVAPAAMDAARSIGRNGDRFPSIKEFRVAYRAAFDRWTAGRQIEEAFETVPPPPEFVEVFATAKSGGLCRSIDDLPVSTKITPRPVWKRWLRRNALGTSTGMIPPDTSERDDAILVLMSYDDGGPMHTEAQRIMDECS